MTDIPPEDLRIEVMRDPPGGQHVGIRTGVAVTHLPTGIRVEVECDRSQHRNRSIALDAIMGAITSPHMR